MQVSSVAIDPDAGFLYVLLIDASADGAVLQQANVPASAGQYAYQFANVPDGSYTIVAGTDADNDQFICDPGEACGGFPTLDQPQVILLDRDLAGLDFSAGHAIVIPSQSLEAQTEALPGYRRLAEPTYKRLDR